MRLLGEVPAGQALIAASEIEPIVPNMLGRELTGRQVGPVGLLEPGEKNPQILPVVPLRIV